MSEQLVHLLCWTLLASMVVFLIVGGVRTFREFKEVMHERRLRRKGFLHHQPASGAGGRHPSGMAFSVA